MNIWTLDLQAGECTEVNIGDRLVGYAIHYSGGWDGYVIAPFGHMKKVTTNEADKGACVLRVNREACG